MNKNIKTFNSWAEDGRDIKMADNHLAPVNKMIEIITKINYKDTSKNKKKSYFELSFATVIKLKDKNLNKEDLEKVILCEVQNDIYPELEKSFLRIIKDSGFPDLKLEKKINFEELYQQKLN